MPASQSPSRSMSQHETKLSAYSQIYPKFLEKIEDSSFPMMARILLIPQIGFKTLTLLYF